MLILLIWQAVDGASRNHYLKAVLMLILVFTMLLEDSIETQAGASFAGLFLGLMLSREASPVWSLKND
jgi:hypothetical protein